MHDQGFKHLNNTPEYHKFNFQTEIISEISCLLWSGEGIKYLRYPGLSLYNHLMHGVFTRLGGVSPQPYASLNTSYSSGDLKKNIHKNLSRIKGTFGISRLVFMNQSHGNKISVIRTEDNALPLEVPAVDAIITDMKDLAILVKQADCQGIIIFDPERLILANVHCGWRGNVLNIIGSVVTRMKHVFGCRACDLVAAIGPSLGPCCAEFTTHRKIFPEAFNRFLVRENHFDLWSISIWQLIQAGLLKKNIELAGICTRCNTDLFYSYRGEGTTGRFGSVAMLK